MLTHRYRAAIFDLDGTLLDTLGDLSDAVNVALEACGLPTQHEEAIRGFIGDGAAVLVQRAVAAAGGHAQLEAPCLDAFKRHYAVHYAERTQPYRGIAELLDGLRARGVALGVLSNKPHAFTVSCSEAFFGRAGAAGGQFEVVLGQRDGVPRKPDPAGALEAAARLGVGAEQCLYVGDSAGDMLTARGAGMVAVGVAWGFRPAAELSAAGAARVIDVPSELLEFFPERKNCPKNA